MTPADATIGGQIRARRTFLGISRKALSASVGLTLAQLRDFETGVERPRATILLEMSRALAVPITYFFDRRPGAEVAVGAGDTRAAPPVTPALKPGRMSLKTIREQYKTAGPEERRRLQELAKALVQGSGRGKTP